MSTATPWEAHDAWDATLSEARKRGAITWKQQVILAAMWSYGRPDGTRCHPSVRTLCDRLGIDRRDSADVTTAMRAGKAAGVLVDTGDRVGPGRKVVVWTRIITTACPEEIGARDNDGVPRGNRGTDNDVVPRGNRGTEGTARAPRKSASVPREKAHPCPEESGPTSYDLLLTEGQEEGGGGGALRPSAGATGLRAPTHAAAGAAVAAIATTVIGRGRAWGEYDARRIDAAQLAAVVAPWLHAGWTADDLAAAAATSARPRSNAARMLQEHLARTLGDTDPATWRQRQAAVAVEPAATTGRGRRGATKKAKAAASLEAAPPPPPPPPPVWLHHLAQEVQDALGRPLAWYYAETVKPDGQSRTGHYVLRHDGADVLVLQGDVGGRDWTATRTDTDQAVEVTAGPPAEATRRILELWRTPTTELTNGASR